MKSKANDSKANIVVRFFSSVKLAIFLFIILAITSIIGTVLPQGESLQFYLENYGPFYFKIIKNLHLYDTYHAWWYLGLMGLFSINLIVCTIKRLPYTLRLYSRDYLDLAKDDLLRRPLRTKWQAREKTNPGHLRQEIVSVFSALAGKPRSRQDVDGGQLLLSEKGRWNYWGVYLIHISVLVIFAGAIFGTFTGFKGRVMLLEGEKTDHAIQMDSHGNVKKIPLGFDIKCNHFKVDFYPNGAPKLFKSDLSILEKGKEVLHKSIVVNSPLTYKGITFYQSSYQSVPDLKVKMVSSDGEQKIFDLSAFDRGLWPEKGILIGILKYLPNVHGAPAARVYVGDPSGSNGDAVWLLMGNDRELNIGKNTYRISLVSAKEKYMTGLQVKKDPGVWLVWLGCALMVLGFGIVFWVGHRRIWLWIGEKDKDLHIILAGQTNKNKVSFEREFEKIKDGITKQIGEQ